MRQFPPNTPFWLFTIAMIAFIAFKIPHLGLPFFWDESGVYGKIIFHLADNQLSIHPSAINEWISRGHPLLYPNFIAAACKIFGTTVTVSHAANLFLTCGLLISMYVHLSRAFHPLAGLVSCLALMSMPLFFTQSVFVLPEIALALSLWWATWGFIHKKYFVYFLSGSAALLIKEPAVIWLGALFGWSVFMDRIPFWKKFIWLAPLIPFGIFLLVQKQTYGWYLFPFHTDSFDLGAITIMTKFKNFFLFLFWKQSRYLWTLIILVGGFLYLRHQKKTSIDSSPKGLPYQAALVAAFVYIAFSSTTFYHDRYIMPSIVMVSALLGMLTFKGVAGQKPIPTLLMLVILIISQIPFMTSKTFTYDNDMSYMRSIELSKKTISYMLERHMLNQDEFFASMPLIYALSDMRFGYLPKDSIARHNKIIYAGTKYAVHTEPGTQIENPEQFPLDTLVHWKDGDIKTTIYLVLPKDSSSVKDSSSIK